MAMGITVTPIMYGPSPLHLYQGEQGFYTFIVAALPGSPAYTSVTGSVRIFDGNGNLVRTLEAPVTLGPDGSATVTLAWDGKDEQGNLVSPGDYAPTFLASADY